MTATCPWTILATLALACSAAADDLRVVSALGLRGEGSDPPLAAPAGADVPLAFVIRGGAPPYRLLWQFGDNTPERRYRSPDGRVALTHRFSVQPGRRRAYYEVHLSVTDDDDRTTAATRTVRVDEEPDPHLASSFALERALQFLHRRIEVDPSRAALPDEIHPMAAHALALQALSNAGHSPFDDPGTDPFAEDARALLATLCRGLTAVDDAAMAGFDCTPRNGRLLFITNPFGEPIAEHTQLDPESGKPYDSRMYEMPIVLMALASVDRPGAEVEVLGRREPLRQVTQDLVETLLAAQSQGGWRYRFRLAPDMSLTQWPVIALEAWEARLGEEGATPASAELKTRLDEARASLRELLKVMLLEGGGIAYLKNLREGTPALTAAGLCSASWSRLPFDDDMVVPMRKHLIDEWAQVGHHRLDTYTMYSVMKAMRNYEDKAQIEAGRLTDRSGRSREWYREFADAIAQRQGRTGAIRSPDDEVSWVRPYDPHGTLETSLAALCLEPRIFEPAPFPSIRTIPERDLPVEVILDHSESISGSPQGHITRYIWAVAGHPELGVETSEPLQRPRIDFKQPGTYQVSLTVIARQSSGRTSSGTARRDLTVSRSPAALGRIIPPPNYVVGPFLKGRRNQVALVPLHVDLYKGSPPWEGLSIQWYSRGGAPLGQPVVVPSRCQFLAQPVAREADRPGQCTISTIPDAAAQAVSLQAEALSPPDGAAQADLGNRPFVHVAGITGFAPRKAALCLILEGAGDWRSEVDLHLVDGVQFGVAADPLPAALPGILRARVLVFDARAIDMKAVRSLQGIEVQGVDAPRDSNSYDVYTKRALDGMRQPSR